MHPQEARVVEELKTTKAAGDWRFVPPYPYGHVQVRSFEPWRSEFVTTFLVLSTLLMLSRRAHARMAPLLGRWIGVALHGEAWASSQHASNVDWGRFADVVHCTIVHLFTTTYALLTLREEITVRVPRSGSREWLRRPTSGPQPLSIPRPTAYRPPCTSPASPWLHPGAHRQPPGARPSVAGLVF